MPRQASTRREPGWVDCWGWAETSTPFLSRAVDLLRLPDHRAGARPEAAPHAGKEPPPERAVCAA